ncbi:hypothetical protein LDO32_05930 [Luteimonas sp. Y-2-2-4F]|nr:hypothetical protein [Luteimonas sp. Y-2-2-4F]MCD9031266.1 hypothetical protein [Luteimonas sp. Y-2-2-4F]
MSHRDRTPLDAEERALAAQLAHHAPADDPSPELDARVLAMAREAAGAGGSGAPAAPLRGARDRRPRRRRWPAAFGIAASLALAVGIAWQLRPLPEAPQAASESAPDGEAVVRSVIIDEPAPPRSVADPAPAAAPFVTGPAPPEPLPDATRRERPREEGEEPAPAAVAREAAPADAPVARRAAPVPVQSVAPTAMPAPPPAPPAPAAPSPVEGQDAVEVTGSRVRSRPAPEAADAAAPQAMRALPPPPAPSPPAPPVVFDDPSPVDAPAPEDDDEALDESPPATVDSPEVHRAWLQRIRELRDAGRLREARESLAEWRNRYPQVPVPDDLKPLADPP